MQICRDQTGLSAVKGSSLDLFLPFFCPEPETLGETRHHTTADTDHRLSDAPKPGTNRPTTPNPPRHRPKAGAKGPLIETADTKNRPRTELEDSLG